MMKITVNSKEIEIETSSFGDLLALFRFNPGKIAVTINGKAVPAQEFINLELHEGDIIEIDRVGR
jgi:thiamine biosynthesis protein ThiS